MLARLSASLLLVLGAPACSDDSAPTDAAVAVDADAGAGDAAIDAPILLRPCTADPECDDGVECTIDRCDMAGFCRNGVDPAQCDDGVFCNGVERCDPRTGCGPGPIETCNDSEVCTLDACDEAAKTCRHAPRDLDEDGDPDWHCEGGADCDDRDPTRGSSSSEVCGDDVDNDCDELVDESMCGSPRFDTCEDAGAITVGETLVVSNRGAAPDYETTCAGAPRKDVVLRFTLDAPRSVRARADGDGIVTLAIRTRCGERASEIECSSSFPANVRAARLEAGNYFLIVNSSSETDLTVSLDAADPIALASNETCESAIDVGAGGSFVGSLVDVRDDVDATCGEGAAPDVAYRVTLSEPKDVRISLVSASGDSLSFSVRRDCASRASEVRCARGFPAGATLFALEPATYFIIIERTTGNEVDYQLEVDVRDPTAPPAGDGCASAVPLTLNEATIGTLRDKQDDVAISCGFFYPDAVYSFTIDAAADVTVLADGDGTYMYLAVQAVCGDDATALRCVSGTPGRARLRGLAAGTYFVVVESYTGAGFELTVATSSPTMATAVEGNDTCDTAFAVPPTGGLFSGDTTLLRGDLETLTCGANARSPDAVFRLDLATDARVTASTSGSAFDTVLHMHDGTCMSGSEDFCDDDGVDGTASLIERVAFAGTHFIVVDGFGSATAGRYDLEVTVSPL